jgi:uncharacterized membrane protein YjgN (DUF898 family)
MTVLDLSAPAGPGVLAAPPADPRPVRFVGESGSYWGLLIRGAFLLMVTLGIYRFWLSTDMRRFLWSNTEFKGQTLEYTGTPYELLIGFLIAIAILVPVYIGFFIVALELGTVGQFITVLGFPVIFFLGQIAVYRARRYRLTRTVFRGVRFHQTGKAWRYAICAMFWWTVVILTLGLAYPFAQASLERFKMRHTRYGNLLGRFEGSGFRLFLRGFLMWILVVAPFAAATAFAIATVDWKAVSAAAEAAASPEALMEKILTGIPGVTLAGQVWSAGFLASIAMAIILFPAFQAMVLRWWASGVRFGEISVTSRLKTRRIYGSYLHFLWIAVTFAVVGLAIVGIALWALSANLLTSLAVRGWTEIAATVASVAVYVIFMLGFSAIYQATAKLGLWRHGVESIEISNEAALDRVTADGAASSAVGEGLADALNVGGF